MELYCEVGDCEEPAVRGTLCALHLKRQQRGQPLTSPVAERLSPEERVIIASGELAEAGDDDADYERKRGSLLRACEGWLRSRGWTPPGRARPPSTIRRTRRRLTWVQLELAITRPRAERGS